MGFPTSPTGVLSETDDETQHSEVKSKAFKPLKRYYEMVWTNVFLCIYLHGTGLCGLYLMIFSSVKWQTYVFTFLMGHIGLVGISAGAHRLWSHRAFKANFPLRTILMLCYCCGYRHCIINWARDHRLHHKFSETDADPYNATRGFFYSHMGWLLTRKHRLVKEKAKTIDLSDLYADPILVFQKKYFYVILSLIGVILPTLPPMYFWGESFVNAYHMNMVRFVYTFNAMWLVNSAAHMWGNRPYEKFINPVESSFVSLLTIGEGWHNFHHTFPWDYKTGELGSSWRYDFTTAFIDFFAKIGWAYDLKAVSEDVVKRRVLRTGDGSHPVREWKDNGPRKEEKTLAE